MDDDYYDSITDYAGHLQRAAATYPAGERMSFITTIREDISTVQTHDPGPTRRSIGYGTTAFTALRA